MYRHKQTNGHCEPGITSLSRTTLLGPLETAYSRYIDADRPACLDSAFVPSQPIVPEFVRLLLSASRGSSRICMRLEVRSVSVAWRAASCERVDIRSCDLIGQRGGGVALVCLWCSKRAGVRAESETDKAADVVAVRR